MTRVRLLLLTVSALCAANAAAQQAFVGVSRSFPPPDFDPTIRVGNTVAVNVSWFNAFLCLPTGCFPVKFQVSAPDSELVSLSGQYDQCGIFSDGPVASTNSGFAYFVRYATPGIKTVSVTVIRCDANLNPTGEVVSNPSAAFEVFCPQGGCAPPPPPPPQQLLRLRAAIGSATLEPAQGVTSPQSAPVNAHFPLGASFRVAAFDENGNPANVTFTLQTAAVEAGVEPGALFPTLVALQYTNAQPNEANFQAVHRGTVALSIVPADPNVQPALLNLIVENPQSLGTANSQFDAIIQDLAHSRGVLPQYIKAIAHHESQGTFNGLSYRYEPIGVNTGDLDVLSHGLDLRTQTPYSDYRIATADYYGPSDPPLAAGPNLLPDDVNPRGKYFITRPDCLIPGSTLLVRRPIRPCDTFVGADEIYFDNRAQNWHDSTNYSRAPDVQADPTLLSFTAQTGLASSYGLMQMMYVTAVDFQWAGIKGNAQFPPGLKNPSFLFDTSSNHQMGGGSLRLGTDVVLGRMTRLLTGSSGIAGEPSLRSIFQRALRRYNRLRRYPNLVSALVDQYIPIPQQPAL